MIPQYSPSCYDSAIRNPLVVFHPPLFIEGCRTGDRRNRAIVGPNGPKNAVDDVKAMTVNA